MVEEHAATMTRAPGRRPMIVLAVAAGVAAYQAAEVARLLIQAGARVIPVLPREARAFLGAPTLAGLTGEEVHDELADVGAALLADAIVFTPAPAELLSRLAARRAGDPLTALLRSTPCPALIAPALSPEAWSHPEVQRDLARLAEDARVELLGRAAEPAAIAAAALARATPRDLAGLRVLVTAGPTVEDIDPVRFLGNRSTGKMGFAVAARAAARGAAVTLIAGPVALPTPSGARRVDVRGALAMRAALGDALGVGLTGADALIMTAAVADYRPATTHPQKRKRTAENLTLELVPNPDLLAEIGAARAALGVARPALVGFAVETADDEQVVAYARGKLEHKQVDLVVANQAGDAFGRDDNRATLVDHRGAEPLGVLPKPELADRILDRVARLCQPWAQR